jgi:hypothetical protein
MGVSAQVTLSGSIESEVHIPQEDTPIGAPDYDQWALTNTYADLQLQSKYVDAGARWEYLKHPMPGFEPDFAGWGVPHFFLKGHAKNLELTVGDYYEQFGSGFVLRCYEERTLGIDNALRGGRLSWKPARGLAVKALAGRQRHYWEHNKAWITGADVEADIGQWIPAWQRDSVSLTLGASAVNKHEGRGELTAMPENVSAFDLRARLQAGGWDLLAEYAHKTRDPHADNHYDGSAGRVVMLSAAWSGGPVEALVRARRTENMAFRSRRDVTGLSSMLNHQPVFAMEHDYFLPASFPYITHPDGEWACQASLSCELPAQTVARMHFSHMHTLGKGFWQWGSQTRYQDLNLQVGKQFASGVKASAMYMNQHFHQGLVEGEGDMIRNHIFVAEAKVPLNQHLSLRGEAQCLLSDADDADEVFGLLCLTVGQHWKFSVSDECFTGDSPTHYPMGSVAYQSDSHTLAVSYGRASDGYITVDGIGRFDPARRGLTVTYRYEF